MDLDLGILANPRGFALGMVALFNPCGFALLPAYLGYFLGLDDGSERESRLVSLNRAQVVGLSMGAGFMVVFGLLGLALAGFMETIRPILPWVTLVMGIGLVALGIAMVRGFQPMLSLPKMQRGTGSRSVFSMFLFGASYALASLTCTIGLFLGVAGDSAAVLVESADGIETRAASFFERVGGFLSYGAGMALMATAVTLAVAFGKKSLVNRFRQVMPKINMISAVVLIIVGVYVAWYGYWSAAVLEGWNPPREPVATVEGWQADFQGWIDDRTALLGWGFVAVNLALVVAGFMARRFQGGGGHDDIDPSDPATRSEPAAL